MRIRSRPRSLKPGGPAPLRAPLAAPPPRPARIAASARGLLMGAAGLLLLALLNPSAGSGPRPTPPVCPTAPPTIRLPLADPPLADPPLADPPLADPLPWSSVGELLLEVDIPAQVRGGQLHVRGRIAGAAPLRLRVEGPGGQRLSWEAEPGPFEAYLNLPASGEHPVAIVAEGGRGERRSARASVRSIAH